ncbi:AraC family transcriptional regulator [Brevibacterium casei]
MTGVMRPGSVDEFERFVGRSLSPHRLFDIDHRCFVPDVWSMRLGRLSLVQFSLGTDAEVDIPEHADYIDVVVARRGGAEIAIGAETVPVTASGTAAILVPQARVRMALQPDYDQIHLRIDESVLRAHSETLRPAAGRSPMRFRSHALPLSAGFGTWLGVLEGLVADGRAGQAVAPLLTPTIEDLLLTQLVVGHPDLAGESTKESDWSTTPKRVRRALDFIADHLGEPVTVTEIAEAAGLSVRTLQRAFREELGTSPVEHLQRQRLHAARSDILSGDETMSDIAFRWGFSHPSRFAAAYRRLFGELPSQTRAQR